jgi:hypothetical protein
VALDAPPSSGAITVRMPKGVTTDTRSRSALCSRSDAARGACSPDSRIGFGRYVMDVAGYLMPGGDTQVTWSIDAFLARATKKGDTASVVLVAKLLGADSVATLLTPEIGATVPSTAIATARLRGRELRLSGVPVRFSVNPPVTATPLRFELNLSAVRQVRENFIRKVRVPTLTGYEVRRIRDHRLVGHYLFRAPDRCTGTWSYELQVGAKRSTGRIPCQASF